MAVVIVAVDRHDDDGPFADMAAMVMAMADRQDDATA